MRIKSCVLWPSGGGRVQMVSVIIINIINMFFLCFSEYKIFMPFNQSTP